MTRSPTGKRRHARSLQRHNWGGIIEEHVASKASERGSKDVIEARGHATGGWRGTVR
jgi:hypothetical protein